MEKVLPHCYIHVLDQNSNVTKVVIGPTTFTKQEHEKIVFGPERMIVVPPRHYCVIKDPAVREDEKTKEPAVDGFGQVKLRHGDREIRFADEWAEPFPLLPGEALEGAVVQMPLVAVDTALRLACRRNFQEGEAKRVAGDEWLFKGPSTYRPRVEVEVLETVVATIVEPDHALRLRARINTRDSRGNVRKAGEEWLMRDVGAYLPANEEEVVGIVNPVVLTQNKALHLRASDNFRDQYGKDRKAGEEWLVTLTQSPLHLADVYEEVVKDVNVTIVDANSWCVVLDFVGEDGKNQYGKRALRRGPSVFFLLPGERLERGVQPVYVLAEDQALLLKALEAFQDTQDAKPVSRSAGDYWMINGPRDFVPRVEMEVVELRTSIPLDENEGIYVRDVKTGAIRAVRGETYMLKSTEVLWEKELDADVERLLEWSYYKGNSDRGEESKQRDKTRMVSFRVPHNAAVQVFDYKTKKSRTEFGPALVMLEPDEEFTVNKLSGDKPKRPDVIKSLGLMLGPDFMTDIIEVETADHARLRLQLSYNWHFEVEKQEGKRKEEEAVALFQVRDFVGDACKAMASRVRGAVAAVSFDEFHRYSARMIREAVFGKNPDTGRIGDFFLFNQNRLMITNIDIQSVEPVDERTRESLQKSVQLAIEITTRKQERNARHAALGIEQVAKGKIERQKLTDLNDAEEERQKLVALQTTTAALASTGTAKAEAEAKAEYLEIEATADVEKAKLSAEASEIESKAELQEIKEQQQLEVVHQAALLGLEIGKNEKLSAVESGKFGALVKAISPQTIKAIASSGPEMQARLLKGLGLKGYLLTDGNSPVNLFNAARGMVGQGGGMGAM